VRVTRVTRVAGGQDGFHARFLAKGKRYEYRIFNAPWLHPLEIGRAWHVAQPLDFEAMRGAAALFVGRHDFASFAANRGVPASDTVRTLTRVAISRRGPLMTLAFEGDGFLYKMVRMLTGTLVRIGQGKADIQLVRDLLANRGRSKTQFAAPSDGLYLTRVYYA
jgi:tRNA pseudouridine38-40 synthase